MSISGEIHLLSVSDIHNSIQKLDGSNSDDDVKVVSDFDTQEDELVDMSTYLKIDSSGESDANNEDPSAPTLTIGSTCSESDSENEDRLVHRSIGSGDQVPASASFSLRPTPPTDDTSVASEESGIISKGYTVCVQASVVFVLSVLQ